MIKKIPLLEYLKTNNIPFAKLSKFNGRPMYSKDKQNWYELPMCLIDCSGLTKQILVNEGAK